MIYENGQTCAVLNFSNKICIPNPHYVRQCNAGVMEDFVEFDQPTLYVTLGNLH